MTQFQPMRELPEAPGYKKGDVLVVFGELFSRGYANGIVEEAEHRGMKVIYATVGRRDGDNQLRALNDEELGEKQQPLINIPLEAGFDLEPCSDGKTTPVDQLKGVKMSEWDQAKLNWDQVQESKENGTQRFRNNVKAYMQELESLIPEGANILFVHTMAGGFPRAKVVMPAANRVFKGFGERYTSSEMFWNSDIGKLCDWSFNDVTGETLFHLIELSAPIREKLQAKGQRVSYVAYGYHGTDVLIGNDYRWQSYSPYLQGWAKIRLENIASKSWEQDVKVSVFNAPEILTNSSSIFLGVEVSLYPLLGALRKEGSTHPEVKHILENCKQLLAEPHSIDKILDYTGNYLESDVIQKWSLFEEWPQHNGPEQMALMRKSSAELIEMHKDTKQLITQVLSEVVFKACGRIMLAEAWQPRHPVWWIGHDAVAKQTVV